MNNLKVRKTRNGQVIAYVENGKAYITARFFGRLKAYYQEHGFNYFVMI